MKFFVFAVVCVEFLLSGCAPPDLDFSCAYPKGKATYLLTLHPRVGSTCPLDKSHIPEQTWKDGSLVMEKECTGEGTRDYNACGVTLTMQCPEWKTEEDVRWSDDWSTGFGFIHYETDSCSSDYDIELTKE